MSDPLIPNYKNNVGRLATDRFDFQQHVDGARFRHKANQIDLYPTLNIDGYTTVTNVQDALEVLQGIVTPPVIADATTVSKGIVQLAGDIGGLATNVRVTSIQGRPVSTLSPNDGDVLTWNNSIHSWTPSSASTTFTAGGDLIGTNTFQQVRSLTGTAGTVETACNNIKFSYNLIGVSLAQISHPSSDGSTFSVIGQSAVALNKNGGNVVVSGGGAGAGGLRGGVSLQINSSNMVQLSEVATNRRVLSLLKTSSVTSSDMPANTGDLVMYVRETATPPTTGVPVNGSILYSYNGNIRIKQPDGIDFAIGSIPNPSIWGDTGQQTYTYRSFNTTSTITPTVALSFPIPDQTAIKVDVIVVGKKQGAADAGEFNLSMGYVRHGGAPVAIGTLTSADARTTTAAGLWIAPTITVSGNTLQVKTGASGVDTINWLIVTQIASSQG